MPLGPDSPLGRALGRGRDRYNACVALAVRQGRRVDHVALRGHLCEVLAPIVDAVATVNEARLDAVTEALFELSVDLLSRDVLGPGCRQPLVDEAWRRLLPRLGARIAEAPRRVAAAMTNAAHQLSLEPSARGGEWIEAMGEVGARAESIAQLLACGRVLAWRCGLAHHRATALAVWAELPEPLAKATLGLEPANAATRDSLRAELADPWRRPGTAAGQPGLAVVARIGGFRGFGGPFLSPPRVFSARGEIWALEATSAWTVHADCFGQTLRRAPPVPEAERSVGPARVEPDGTVAFAGLRLRIEALRGASSYAATDTVLAVTSPRSHRITLVARPGGNA